MEYEIGKEKIEVRGYKRIRTDGGFFKRLFKKDKYELVPDSLYIMYYYAGAWRGTVYYGCREVLGAGKLDKNGEKLEITRSDGILGIIGKGIDKVEIKFGKNVKNVELKPKRKFTFFTAIFWHSGKLYIQEVKECEDELIDFSERP